MFDLRLGDTIVLSIPQVKRDVQLVKVEKLICPHCQLPIEKDGLYRDVTRNLWFHYPCYNSGPIMLD